MNKWALGLAWYGFGVLFCCPSYTQLQKFLDRFVNRYLMGSEECLSTGTIHPIQKSTPMQNRKCSGAWTTYKGISGPFLADRPSGQQQEHSLTSVYCCCLKTIPLEKRPQQCQSQVIDERKDYVRSQERIPHRVAEFCKRSKIILST